MECSDEPLDLGTPHGVLPSLGLCVCPRSWLKYGIRARSRFSQLIHSGATSCAALAIPRKEARRRLPARPSMRNLYAPLFVRREPSRF